MAVQGSGPRWKPHGTGRVLEGDQDILAAGNLFHGPYEGNTILVGSYAAFSNFEIDERGRRNETRQES